jgi:hypothetical protein
MLRNRLRRGPTTIAVTVEVMRLEPMTSTLRRQDRISIDLGGEDERAAAHGVERPGGLGHVGQRPAGKSTISSVPVGRTTRRKSAIVLMGRHGIEVRLDENVRIARSEFGLESVERTSVADFLEAEHVGVCAARSSQ